MSTISVKEYLEKNYGRRFRLEGGLLKTNSPFSRDSNPSFVIYPKGDWYDFSVGKGGTIYTLIRELGDSAEKLQGVGKWKDLPPIPPKPPWDGFVPSVYTSITWEEEITIRGYAQSRRIDSGFIPTTYKENDQRHLAMLFPHVDALGKMIGGKFRNIAPKGGGDRFRLRGKLGFYILENLIDTYEPPIVYVIESETSANSLWEYCKQERRNAVIISAGANSTVPHTLPMKYEGFEKRLILDYDLLPDHEYPDKQRQKYGTGISDKIYLERLKKFEHLNLKEVKIVLPSKEDINSLWCKNQTDLIETIL